MSKPHAYVGQMEESAQFYTNKVLKEFREYVFDLSTFLVLDVQSFWGKFVFLYIVDLVFSTAPYF